ncbi:MAG: BACON domain-containing protein [Paludibacteraceae bacterium]|nr:BACON domain-containing protein [Paludibacteraceae bacterium]
MKRLSSLFFAATLLFAACSNKPETPEQPALSLDNTEITAPAKGGEYTVRVITENQWTATPQDAWVRVSPAYGVGTTDVTVRISAAKEAVADVSAVIFADADNNVTLDITREALATSLSVFPESLTCPKDGYVYSLQISSTIQWQAESNVSWMTVNPGVGKNNGKVEVTIEPASIPEITEGRITVSPFGSGKDVEPVVIPVTRYGTDAASLSAVPDGSEYINCPAKGGDFTASISSNVEWKAEANVDWISFVNPENLGSSVLYFTVEPNPHVVSDVAVITIREQTSYNKPAELYLYVTREAAAPQIAISQNVLNIGKQSLIQRIDVESNTDWYVRSDQSWVRFVPEKGSGNGYVWMTVDKNETNDSRRAEPIFVATGVGGATGGAVLVVNQERTDPSFSLSTENITTTTQGGDFSFYVFTTSAWKVSLEGDSSTKNSNWLQLKTKSGNGNGTVEFTVLPPNETTQDVAKYIVITEDNPKEASPVSVRCKVIRKGNSHVTRTS